MNSSQKLVRRTTPFFTMTVVAALLFSVIGLCQKAHADSQSQGQATTELYADQLMTARPYPLNGMNDSSERAGLTERLLRMNNPNKIGYVTLLTQNGQVFLHLTIKGKVSSTASQLTNTHNVQSPHYNTAVVVDSMGDDGSYGPEEGGKKGIFFFTTSGVLIEWNGLWQYSDAPITMVTPALVFIKENAKPTTNEGHLAGDGQK